MIYITIAIIILILLLLVLSTKKYGVIKDSKGNRRFLKTLSTYLFKDIFKINHHSTYYKKSYDYIVKIYGATYAKEEFQKFWIKKITGLLMVIILISSFIVIDYIKEAQTFETIKNNRLMKPEIGQTKPPQSIEIKISGDNLSFSQIKEIQIPSKAPNEAEKKAMLKEVKTALDEYMKQMEYIEGKIILPTAKSLVKINWESKNPNILSSEGEVNENSFQGEEVKVDLLATLYLDDNVIEVDYPVTVRRKTVYTENELRVQLDQLVEDIQQNKTTDEFIELPLHFQGVESYQLDWKSHKDRKSFYFFFLEIALIVIIVILENQQLKKALDHKNLCMELAFPDFISKLVLLISAGMSLTNALEKIILDYGGVNEDYQKIKGNDYLYKELEITLLAIKSGVYEARAYEDLGRRNNISVIRKFAYVISQNIKRGNEGMLPKLTELSHETWEDRKNKAKILGEEASTKLLFPMMLMFIVIIIIVMAPAMMTMGI